MSKLGLEAFQIVDAVDRHGSFAKAGQELHRAPSTISYTVGKLEDDLGLQVFQLAGVGCGFLPEPCARAAIARRLLVEKQVEEARPPETCYLAWRSGDDGAALRWWRERCSSPACSSACARGCPAHRQLR